MDGDYGLRDLRFDGYSNEDLARQVDGLRDGAGSETMQDAVSALVELADTLDETDRVLRDKLDEIGVSWQGAASEEGHQATQTASIYAEEAREPVTDSAKGVDQQGATFTTTRNSAPDSGTLRGPSQENFGDRVAGFFGHTTDHAKQVRATNQARDQAVDGLNGYRQSSSDALDRSRALPVPPGMNLVAQPAEQELGITGASGFGSGNPPGVGGTGPGGSGGSSLPTSGPGGGSPQLPTTGTPPVEGPPGRQFGANNPFAPTALPSGPSGPQLPLRTPLNPILMGEAATLMGAGGASGAGTGAERERTVRGGTAGGASAKGTAPGRTVPVGSVPDEEARAARNAERYGARTGRPASSIMQPAAAAGRSAEGEDDKEHVRRYGIDSGDVFDDERVVAPESIGDEPDDH